jgi:hypothetical protein
MQDFVLKITKAKKNRGVAQVLDCQPLKYKALSLKSQYHKTKKKKPKQNRRRSTFPVTQQKGFDWCNVGPVIGPYARLVIGGTRYCAVTGANYKPTFACDTTFLAW